MVTALVLGSCVAALSLWAAVELRPVRPSKPVARPARLPLRSLGARAEGLLRRTGVRRMPTLDPLEQRLAGAGVLTIPAVVLVEPLLGPLIVLGIVAAGYMRRRNTRLRRRAEVARELPMAVELLRLLVSSGCNVNLALRDCVAHLDGPLAEGLGRVMSDVDNGMRLADALELLPGCLGDDVRPLVWSLASAERYGSPLSDVLERLAQETSADLSRRSEEAARRLSVQILFPVAGLTFPAFALLTVAPFIAGSLKTLASAF